MELDTLAVRQAHLQRDSVADVGTTTIRLETTSGEAADDDAIFEVNLGAHQEPGATAHDGAVDIPMLVQQSPPGSHLATGGGTIASPAKRPLQDIAVGTQEVSTSTTSGASPKQHKSKKKQGSASTDTTSAAANE